MDKEAYSNLSNSLIRVLSENDGALFAYFYGSMLSEDKYNDIDIAVYMKADENPHRLSADLKIAFSRETGLEPDVFDIRILNDLDERSDIFGLLYLKNVLEDGQVLVDKKSDAHSDFLERYGVRFRECEGLMQEVLV